MTRVLVAFAVAFAAIALCACATKPGGELFRPAMLGPEEAVIYVFREPERAARSAPVSVFINQEFQGELRPGEHLVHIVGPGEYLVRVEAAASMVREVRVAAGNVEYQRVKMQRRSRPIIEDVDPDVGRKLIAGTRRVEPRREPTEEDHERPRQSAAR